MEYPLISCICILTKHSLPIEQIVNNFIAQTYTNKELLILYESNDCSIGNKLTEITQENITFFEYDSQKFTLGQTRSFGIEKSNGEFICYWSDDCWHHCGRLEFQYETTKMTSSLGSILNQVLIFDHSRNKAYVSINRAWEETLMLNKETLVSEGISDFLLGDGTSVLVMMIGVGKEIFPINNFPNLYIKSYYKGKHVPVSINWEEIIDFSYELELIDSNKIKNILTQKTDTNESSILIDQLLENPVFEEDINNDENEQIIPKIIHLIDRNNTNHIQHQANREIIERLHPKWTIKIYNDTDVESIITNHFPELLTLYKSHPYEILRRSIFRILIVYLEGGFFIDDTMYCLKNLDNLCQHQLVLAEEKIYTNSEKKLYNIDKDFQLANYMFGSIPKHYFWIELLLEIVKRFNINIKNQVDIQRSVGAILFTQTYFNNKEKFDVKILGNKFRRCVSSCRTISCHFGEYAVRIHSNNWTVDEFILKPKNNILKKAGINTTEICNQILQNHGKCQNINFKIN